MKISIIALVAFAACAAAAPSSSVYKDVYRNILAPTQRIIGGETAERNQFPYQVSVRWGVLGEASHICGGTLISETRVLTAAHCRPYSVGTYDVVVGLLRQGEIHADVQTIAVEEFITHPGYPGGSVVAGNDIAIIKLATPAVLSEAVQLAPLPVEADCDAIGTATLSGWGLTSWLPIPPVPLYWADLPRITNQQCADDLTALLGSSEPLDETMICTGSNPGKTQSACSGDSGGPLVTPNGAIVGVVSWGISPCGTEGAPSVFTRVCSHLDFINENL